MTRARFLLSFLAVCLCVSGAPGCGKIEETPAGQPAGGGGGGATAANGPIQIVFLGDSLTAGSGLLSNQSFPALVQDKFAAEGYTRIEVENAGVTGDTSAGGVRRVDQVITSDTRILVVCLGGNDALRGLTVLETQNNLAGIIDAALARGVAVLLIGIEAPTNYGEDYRVPFHDIFLQLLRQYRGRIAFMPFLLQGVAGVPSLNQPDGLHPNVEGTKIVAENVYQKLKTMVDSMGGG
jgi:acyl-CoA thioesterase-1